MTSLDEYLDGLKDRHSPPDELHTEVTGILRNERNWEAYRSTVERRYLFAQQEKVYEQELSTLVKSIGETKDPNIRHPYIERFNDRTDIIMDAMNAKLQGDVLECSDDYTMNQLIKASTKHTNGVIQSLLAEYMELQEKVMGNDDPPKYLN